MDHQGFRITHNINDIQAIFEELVREDGEEKNAINDYRTQQDVTTKPIATNSQHVLHALMRTFDHWMKTIMHLKAGVLDWSESLIFVSSENAKQEICERMYTDIMAKNETFPTVLAKVALLLMLTWLEIYYTTQ